jgi:cell division protein FtsQ
VTQTSARRLHGASVLAPDEGFSASDSPLPSAVGPRDSGPPPGVGSRLWFGLRVFLGIGAVVGTSVAVAASAHRYALTSPRFALEKLELSGAERFSADEVKRLGGIGVGDNLFALDTRAVEAKLLQNPWLASARVARRLPSVLEITLTERKARAVALIGGRLYLVSKQAEPFKELEAQDPVDLPVITGVKAENLGRDKTRELARLEKALEVLGQYERLGMSRVHAAQEIHLGEGGALTLTVGREGLVIHLGEQGLRQRLLMAERVVEETKRSARLPGIVFADNRAHPERVVVRMR